MKLTIKDNKDIVSHYIVSRREGTSGNFEDILKVVPADGVTEFTVSDSSIAEDYKQIIGDTLDVVGIPEITFTVIAAAPCVYYIEASIDLNDSMYQYKITRVYDSNVPVSGIFDTYLRHSGYSANIERSIGVGVWKALTTMRGKSSSIIMDVDSGKLPGAHVLGSEITGDQLTVTAQLIDMQLPVSNEYRMQLLDGDSVVKQTILRTISAGD